MILMFYECKSLKEINLSNFNQNDAIKIRYMFFHVPNELIKIIKAQNKNLNDEIF